LVVDLVGVRLTKLFEWILGRQFKIKIMLNGKALRQILDKMMISPVAQEARVQVRLPDGQHFDITSLQLMENKLLGARETHRLVFTIKPETWNMGKVLKKID
tara:strand:- start:290 stop:595 length:306 start_codon:yes stop_codon:yes gene_type:complete